MEQKSLRIKFNQCGGPEVLELEDYLVSDPLENEVLIHQHAIGVNFIDTYYRSGLYQANLPSGIGKEGAGVVEKVGKSVTHLKVGDRVAYAQGPLGAYSEKRVIEARHLVLIPEGVSFVEAASVMLKGLTVYYLFKDLYRVSKGEKILFHSAAGGVGLIACQWARHLGVDLIGTVSSKEKADLAKKYGAFATIDYTKENIAERVLAITEGAKLSVVYDSVGKSTFESSLDCLRPKGLMVNFGNSSGPVTGVSLSSLAQRGSLFVTRPMLWDYMDTYEKLSLASSELFSLVEKGIIKADVSQVYLLKDAGKAHEELANRNRLGGIVLVP